MTWEAWLTLIVVTETISVLVTERISPTFVVLGPVVVLLVTGVCVRHGHAGGTRTARLCDCGGHRSVRLVPLPDRLSDQHDGLRDGWVSLHRLLAVGLPPHDRDGHPCNDLHSAVVAALVGPDGKRQDTRDPSFESLGPHAASGRRGRARLPWRPRRSPRRARTLLTNPSRRR